MNRLSASVTQSDKGAHFGQIFFQRVRELDERTFLNVQRPGGFEDISWHDFGAMVQDTILGLYSLGVNKGDNVAIAGDNSLPRVQDHRDVT